MGTKTVAIGMSGGVDSSAAAMLLKERDWNVIGVTLRLWDNPLAGGAAEDDARRVADAIGIPHFVLDIRDMFIENVIDPFAAAYIAGRTPNPCILCNRHIKWEALLTWALANGAEAIATGHYARVQRLEENGRYTLQQSPGGKDQSYALYRLTQEQLARTVMPLWGMTKDEVRSYAVLHGLPVANKPDSQEICFVPDRDYAAFVERHTGKAAVPGDFVDASGKALARHGGITHYTIGQRKGLGVAFGKPVFVTEICPAANTVVLGTDVDLHRRHVTAGEVCFMGIAAFEGEIRAKGKIRYNQTPADCSLRYENGLLECEFDEPQRAITPGQAVVFYRGDYVLCGGTIQ